jgi:flagellar capping protein FliD
LSEQLDSYLDYDGVFDSIESGYESQLADIENQYNDHIEYINSYTDTLKKQFASLDKTMAVLNAQREYMSGQLAQLASLNNQ